MYWRLQTEWLKNVFFFSVADNSCVQNMFEKVIFTSKIAYDFAILEFQIAKLFVIFEFM